MLLLRVRSNETRINKGVEDRVIVLGEPLAISVKRIEDYSLERVRIIIM